MVLMAVAAAATVAIAQPSGRSAAAKPGERMERRVVMRKAAMEKLDLTDQQRADLAKARFAFQKQQIELQAKIRIARLEMREQMLADKPDRTALEKGIKAVSDLQYKAKLNRLDHMLAMRGILTPEQQKKMKGMMWNRGERMMRNRGDRMMRGERGGGLIGDPMGFLEDEGDIAPDLLDELEAPDMPPSPDVPPAPDVTPEE